MLFDGYEQYNNDRTDVIVVSRSGSEDEPESEPAANDCTHPCHLLVLVYILYLTCRSLARSGHDGPSPSQGPRTRDRGGSLQHMAYKGLAEVEEEGAWAYLRMRRSSMVRASSKPSEDGCFQATYNPVLISARRILFFPYGNQVDHASFYLEQAWEKEPPENWYACVQFALVLWNVNDPSIHVSHGKQIYALLRFFLNLFLRMQYLQEGQWLRIDLMPKKPTGVSLAFAN